MTNELNIFDAYSHIRDLTDAETVAAIEALPDDHRKVLFECIEAVTARDACQDQVAVARRSLRGKEAVYHAALDADHKANPAATHQSELLRTIAANEGRALAPVEVNKEARAALAEADLTLAEARNELTRSSTLLRTLERDAGLAIDAWRKCLTTPSAEQVVRQYIASGQAERQRRVDAGLSAETPKIASKYQSELDKNFANRGKVANRLPVYRGPR
jgi:hypothetical protein